MCHVLELFLVEEGLQKAAETKHDVTLCNQQIIYGKSWHNNPLEGMDSLYLIRVPKSLLKGRWMWRPMAAPPQTLMLAAWAENKPPMGAHHVRNHTRLAADNARDMRWYEAMGTPQTARVI